MSFWGERTLYFINTKTTIVLSLYLISLCLVNSAFGKDANQWFIEGKEAFQNEDYITARQRFLQVRAAGMDSAQLEYNLGVTNYKLGYYPSSYDAFIKARTNTKLAPLVYYNLGLVSIKLKRYDEAVDWFDKTHSQTDNKDLKHLAKNMLAKITDKRPQPKYTQHALITDDYSANSWTNKRFFINSQWRAMIRSDVGVDNNVALYRHLHTNDTSNAADQFATAYFLVRAQLLPAIDFEISSYLLNYATQNQYDYSALSFTINYSKSFSIMDMTFGTNMEKLTLGGNDFQQNLASHITFQRTFSIGQRLTLQLTHVTLKALSRKFKHLKGKRQEIETQWQLGLNEKKLLLFYRFSHNNRQDSYIIEDDKKVLAESHSPASHTIGGIASLNLSPKWRSELFSDFTHIDYPDPNRIATNRYIFGEEELIRAGLRFSRYIGKSIKLLGEYAYSNNASLLAKYAYQNNRYTMGIRWKY